MKPKRTALFLFFIFLLLAKTANAYAANNASESAKAAPEMKGSDKELVSFLYEENDKLSRRIEDLEKSNAQLKKEAREYYLKLQEPKFARSDINGLKKALDTARIDNAALQKKIAESQHQTLKLQKENAGLRKRLTYLNNKSPRLDKGPAVASLQKKLANLESFNLQLQTKAKELYLKAQDADSAKRDMDALSKMLAAAERKNADLKSKNEKLTQQDTSLKKKFSVLYQKLGTAYTEAKLFDLAIEAYNKSLDMDPYNAEVHYNLGILYKHRRDNNDLAKFHLKKYLELKPDAENKKEVEYFIKMLKQVQL
jgi:tetratricopeptide (TPR) repeat protein